MRLITEGSGLPPGSLPLRAREVLVLRELKSLYLYASRRDRKDSGYFVVTTLIRARERLHAFYSVAAAQRHICGGLLLTTSRAGINALKNQL